MRVLVTGANGFIGTHLVQELDANHEVIALARSAPTFVPSPSTRWIEHDLVEPLEAAALPDAVDAVIHLDETRALEPLERNSQWDSDELPETYPSAL